MIMVALVAVYSSHIDAHIFIWTSNVDKMSINLNDMPLHAKENANIFIRERYIRLMAGLLLLKEIKGLSDEEVCCAWRENPYFQYFCGEEYFQHSFPVEPPSLSIFRKRIGEDGMHLLLVETIRIGLKAGVVDKKDLQHVNIDTTVQEKAVRFPTDSHLEPV